MRFLLCFIGLLIAGNVSSQQKTTNDDALGTIIQLKNITSDAENAGANNSSYKGTYLLFKDWNNSCSIQIVGKKYALKNVNFNVQNNEFMYKAGTDEILTIAPEHIDFIRVKDKNFKYFMYEGKRKFFEILFEDKNGLSLFKGHHVRILPKSELGMLSRPKDEIIKEQKFYLFKDAKPVLFKLKKKDLLKIIDKEKENAILKYVKKNGLSYKKEKDMIEIFKYHNEI